MEKVRKERLGGIRSPRRYASNVRWLKVVAKVRKVKKGVSK